MPLVPTADLLHAAVGRRTGIGAFNVIHLETAEALVERCRAGRTAPVILQISAELRRRITAASNRSRAAALAARARVIRPRRRAPRPRRGRAAGPAGGRPRFRVRHVRRLDARLRANVAATVRVVEYAHAERRVRGGRARRDRRQGRRARSRRAHRPGSRRAASSTRPVSTPSPSRSGRSHAMTERTAALDLDLDRPASTRRATFRSCCTDPPGSRMRRSSQAIRAGMTKINVSTHLNGFFTERDARVPGRASRRRRLAQVRRRGA